MRLHIPVALLALGVSMEASALDLREAVDQALGRNPELVGQRHEVASARENITLSAARLKPNLRLNLARSHNETQRTLLSPLRSLDDEPYASQRDALQLVQPLLRVPEFYGVRLARARARAGEQALASQEQLLIARVAQAYFELLVAGERDRLTSTRLQLARTVLAAAQAGLQGGAASRSDVEDARARVDAALAEQVETAATRDMAAQGLLALLGPEASLPDMIAALGDEDLPDDPAWPATAAGWLTLAERGNGDLAAYAEAVVAAEAGLNQARAARLPSIDLVANRSLSSSDSESSIGYRYDSRSVGLQLSYTVYAGGAIGAQVRQARAARGKAVADRDLAESRLRQQVTEEFARFQAAGARTRALRTAVESATQAVQGNEKGLQAGTRNVIDLLDAQSRLADARLSLFQARVARMVAALRLQALAGQLDLPAVDDVNALLK
ncbi:MAG: hypothetical protein RL026_374 [Pseudomonadota bacterium]